jgi:hypothetical protein
MTIKNAIKEIKNELDQKNPETMDELLNVVFSVESGKKYGFSFGIVKRTGVNIYITGNKISHKIFFPVLKGIGKFVKAGWKVETE